MMTRYVWISKFLTFATLIVTMWALPVTVKESGKIRLTLTQRATAILIHPIR